MVTTGTEINWFENDELFFKEFKTGYPWQLRAAIELLREGFPVQVSVPEFGMTLQERIKRFSADDVDIMIYTEPHVVIEVKSRDYSFSNAEDYPFPTIFVGTVSSWDIAKKKPHFVVVVSQITGAKIVVSRKTKKHWTIEPVHDKKRNIDCPSYCAPKSDFKTWEWLVKQLHTLPLS